jgi:hypothetical protein
MHTFRGRQSSHRLRGAFSREIFFFFPGYAKDAYPGLMSLHASGVAQPEGLQGT